MQICDEMNTLPKREAVRMFYCEFHGGRVPQKTYRTNSSDGSRWGCRDRCPINIECEFNLHPAQEAQKRDLYDIDMAEII